MDDRLRVVVYSHDAAKRRMLIDTVGTRPHPAVAPLDYLEVATPAALIRRLDVGDVDLAVLDGDATPAGGLGIARQLRDELPTCPPIVALLGRADDAWLAKWSGVDAAVQWPSDPIAAGAVIAQTLLARSRC